MRIPFRKASPVIFVLSALALGMLPTRANAQAELTVAKSIEVLNELALNPKNGPPKPILLKAEGIAIIPDQVSAGFVLGASFGKGVVMVRKADGSWSNPVFINAFGGSFGLQAGAQATDLVLVFKGRRSVESFLNGKGKITLGLDASAAAGPVGRNFEAGTDLAFKAEILSYSRSRGIFAGVSATGGTLSVDRKANAQYYTLPIGSGEIFADNATVNPPPSSAILKRVLTSQTGIPVVRKARPHIPIEPVEGEPTIIIEGDEPVIDAPTQKPASRKSAPQSKSTAGKSARLDSRRSVNSTVDDEVMLSTNPADSDEETPVPTPTPRKARSASWKKSTSGSTASKSPRGASSAKSDLEAEIDDTARSVSRSDER